MTASNLHAALLAARMKMESPKKVATNPHFGSRYAPLDELVRVSFAPLAEQGLMLTQHTLAVDERMILVTRLLAADGGAMECGSYDLGPLISAQAMGSNLSYARRYSMAAVLGLAAEDDDDGNNAEHAQPVAKPAVKREVTGDRATLEANLLAAWKASRTPAQKSDPDDWKNRGSAIKKLLGLARFIKPAEMTDEQLMVCIEAWGGAPAAPDAVAESTGEVRLATRPALVALVTAEAQKRGLNFSGLVKAMRSMGVYVQDKEGVLMADLTYGSLAEVMMKWTGVGYTASENLATTDDDALPF